MSSIREPSVILLEFMSHYPKYVQDHALGLRAMVLREAPNSFELIYDSYNALSTAFSLSEDLNKAFCHIALYPKHINLGFNYGSELADSENLLTGSGKYIRHLKIKKAADLERPHVRDFIKKAIHHIHQKFPDAAQSSDPRAIIKSVSDNKRRPN